MKTKDSVLLPVAIFCIGFIVIFLFIFYFKFAKNDQIQSIYFEYDDKENTAKVISDIDERIPYQGDIVIPSTVSHNNKTYLVTGISYWAFHYNEPITSISIPNSITDIGYGSYYGSDSLTAIYVAKDNPKYCSIDGIVFSKDSTELLIYPKGRKGAYTIPDFVTKIENSAFYNCKGLTSVTIPDGVKSIESNVFCRCPNLSTITLPASVENAGDIIYDCDSLVAIYVSEDNAHYCSIDGVLYTKDTTTIIQYPGGKTDTIYTLPKNVINIGEGAFANNNYLVSVNLPKGVKRIGDCAFAQCGPLKSVNIPKGVTYIGDYAFHFSDSLTYADIPNSVQYIGGHAFNHCNLSSVNIPEGIKEIKTETFLGCPIKSVKIPNSVTIIGCQAFRGCKLTHVQLGKGLTRIEAYAFLDCPIKSIKIPEGITTIGYEAFNENVLNSIEIPQSVTSIGEDCDCEGRISMHYY